MTPSRSRKRTASLEYSAQRLVEFTLGDAFLGSTSLAPKVKELIAIASLTATGRHSTQLKNHVVAAIRAGYSRKEIVEVVIQSLSYSDFKTSLPALKIIKTAFEQFAASTKP